MLHITIVQALPSTSLHPGQALAPVSLECRGINLLLYLARTRSSGVSSLRGRLLLSPHTVFCGRFLLAIVSFVLVRANPYLGKDFS